VGRFIRQSQHLIERIPIRDQLQIGQRLPDLAQAFALAA
jgi:hypothetical protein